LICDDDEITKAIASVLAPLRSDRCPNVAFEIGTDPESGWLVSVGDAEPIRLGSRLSVVLRTIGEVNDLAVASVPNDLVFHAGRRQRSRSSRCDAGSIEPRQVQTHDSARRCRICLPD
jgi:hypothetical protein